MDTLQKLGKAISKGTSAQVSKLCQKYLSEKTLTHVIHKTTNYESFWVSKFCYLNKDQDFIAHWDFYPNLGYASAYISLKEIEIRDRRFKTLKNATAFVQKTLVSYGYILTPETAQRKDTAGT